MHPTSNQRPLVLLAGASRGLGCAMAEEFVRRDWNVIGTVRKADGTPLHALAQRHPDRIEIEHLDVTVTEQIDALDARLTGRRLDMLFVNAGITNANGSDPIGAIATEDFVRVMLTNALAPMWVIERLLHRVTATGLVGVMSSGRGSIANNTSAQEELYRGSKAALNMFMRSFAVRQADSPRPLVLMAPGWVRTEMGGPEARLGIDDSVPGVVATLLAAQTHVGLQYLDYRGRTLPW